MSHTPEHAIGEWLADPGLKGPEGTPLLFRVLPNTIRLVKRRGGPTRQICYVTCDADGGLWRTTHTPLVLGTELHVGG
jgi:hypothetical protein